MKQLKTLLFLALCATAMPEALAGTNSGTCGSNLTWTYDTSTSTLTISGTGKMDDYTSGSNAPWSKFVTSVVIQNGVTSIGNYAFYFCMDLTSVSIPSSVTSIGECAFYYCQNLASVSVPSSVKSVGDDAFYYCNKLPVKDGIRYAGTYLIKVEDTSRSTYTIQSGTKIIGARAFYSCRNLASITIPSGVISIGKSAFSGCPITSISIPNGVKIIEESTFYGCTKLASVTIPSSVTSIGMFAFQECSSLSSITIPSSVTDIGWSAFSACFNLSSVTLSNGLKSIADNVFDYCRSIKSITIPKSVTSIGIGVFEGCSNLASISVQNGNTVYDSRDNCNAIIATASNTLIAGCMNTIIPDNITSIQNYAFNGCSWLTTATIPKGVVSIGVAAFEGCSSLANMYFNSNPSMSSAGIPSTTKLHLSVSEKVGFNGSNANTYADATYERELADSKYGTVIFPFAIDDDTKDSYEFYELDGQEGGRLNFTPVDDPQPGTPYLYKNAEGKKADCFTSGGRVTICTTVSDMDAGDGWTMKGNYESLVITDAGELDVTYYLSNNKVMNATTSLTLKPFRAYFQGPSYASTFADAGVKSIAIRTGEGTTLVSPETMEEVPAVYYDLSGRAVTEPQSGIYIVNGKKLMVK